MSTENEAGLDYTYTTTAPILSDAEVWLRCYTAILSVPHMSDSTGTSAGYADKALKQYKRRYGDEIS